MSHGRLPDGADGDVDGEDDGDVDGDDEAEGDAEGEADWDGVGLPLVVTPPVQATPLRVNPAGTGLLLPHEALKPKLAVPPLASAPFHAAFATVTWAPDWVYEPPHSWVMVCPAVKDQPNCQEVIGSPRLVMMTL